MGDKNSSGKGDRYRPVDQKKYAKNWEQIYGSKKKKQPKKRKK